MFKLLGSRFGLGYGVLEAVFRYQDALYLAPRSIAKSAHYDSTNTQLSICLHTDYFSQVPRVPRPHGCAV